MRIVFVDLVDVNFHLLKKALQLVYHAGWITANLRASGGLVATLTGRLFGFKHMTQADHFFQLFKRFRLS